MGVLVIVLSGCVGFSAEWVSVGCSSNLCACVCVVVQSVCMLVIVVLRVCVGCSSA